MMGFFDKLTRLSAEYFFAIFSKNLLTFICRTPFIKKTTESLAMRPAVFPDFMTKM